jgi:hypothetical protein
MRIMTAVAVTIALGLANVQVAGQTRQGKPQDTITVGTTTLSIGMSRESVTAKLGGEYKLQNEGENTLLVIPMNASPGDAVASIELKEGKIRSVRKYWSPKDQQKPLELARNLFSLLASFPAEARAKCAIIVGEVHEPNLENKIAFISCGKKSIDIEMGRGGLGTESVTLDEVLGSETIPGSN